MARELRLRRYNNPRWPADRAMHDADCWTFIVSLGNVVLQEFCQFNEKYDVTGDYDATYREALNYSQDVADELGMSRPLLVTMVKKPIEKVEWVEEGTEVE